MTLQVYEVAKKFPQEERFGLVSQLRRAASSVPANIAEDFGKRTPRDFLRHLDIAGGSLEETRYFLLLAKELNYLTAESHAKICAVATRAGGSWVAWYRHSRKESRKVFWPLAAGRRPPEMEMQEL